MPIPLSPVNVVSYHYFNFNEHNPPYHHPLSLSPLAPLSSSTHIPHQQNFLRFFFSPSSTSHTLRPFVLRSSPYQPPSFFGPPRIHSFAVKRSYIHFFVLTSITCQSDPASLVRSHSFSYNTQKLSDSSSYGQNKLISKHKKTPSEVNKSTSRPLVPWNSRSKRARLTVQSATKPDF